MTSRRKCSVIPVMLTIAIVFIPSQPLFAAPPDAQSRCMPYGDPPEEGYELYSEAVSKRGQKVISGVPAYEWRHGCGPTAAGMVIGYWDGLGFDLLVEGAAGSQTSSVNAMIASSEHYEDYSLPIDDWYTGLLPDKSYYGGAHTSHCVADFMGTSWYAYYNMYGGSWFSDVEYAVEDYVAYINATHNVHYYVACRTVDLSSFTWEDYVAEIDADRPLVLLVDTDGDGDTDHFVTAVGYRDSDDNREYACFDTWRPVAGVRWERFREMSDSYDWGIFGATLVDFPTDGACCDPVWGTCTVMSLPECDAAGLNYMGEGVPCDPNPCVQPATGACCHTDSGTCEVLAQVDCESMQLTYIGDDVPCTPNPCPLPQVGACCDPLSGDCAVLRQDICESVSCIYSGDGTDCDPNPCLQPVSGACCRESGFCTVTSPEECNATGLTYWGDGTFCTPNPCPQPAVGACCSASGICTVGTGDDCFATGGSYWGDDTTCDPNPCPQPARGACCSANGGCRIAYEADCTGATETFCGDATSCPCPCLPPAEPTYLQASYGAEADAVTLSWSYSFGYGIVLKYCVYRATSENGQYAAICDWRPNNGLPRFVDTSPQTGSNWYRVKTGNDVGESDLSEAANAVRPAPVVVDDPDTPPASEPEPGDTQEPQEQPSPGAVPAQTDCGSSGCGTGIGLTASVLMLCAVRITRRRRPLR